MKSCPSVAYRDIIRRCQTIIEESFDLFQVPLYGSKYDWGIIRDSAGTFQQQFRAAHVRNHERKLKNSIQHPTWKEIVNLNAWNRLPVAMPLVACRSSGQETQRRASQGHNQTIAGSSCQTAGGRRNYTSPRI